MKTKALIVMAVSGFLMTSLAFAAPMSNPPKAAAQLATDDSGQGPSDTGPSAGPSDSNAMPGQNDASAASSQGGDSDMNISNGDEASGSPDAAGSEDSDY
jgi:hypothetical protein